MKNNLSTYVPWVAAGLAGLCIVFAAVPRGDRDGEMNLQEFGRLPVVDRGRVKPFDTMARTTLMTISGRQTYADRNGDRQPAIKWALEVMTSNPRLFSDRASDAQELKVFRIENLDVLQLLDLKERPGSFRYAVSEFADKLGPLTQHAERASRKDAKKHSLFDAKILQLAQHLELYSNIAKWASPHPVPPASPGGDWKTLGQAFVEAQVEQRDNPAARALAKILMAYAEKDVKTFNRELATYRAEIEKQMPDNTARASFETFFNNFAPFYVCSVLYVLVFLLACIGWLALPQTLQRSAFWVAVVAVVVHTGALFARMYIMQRPMVFVTNLYSSAVFIGWMSVVLGLIYERIYRNGLGNALAGATGAMSLVVAHYLGSDGDTMEMLQAVLDTNFWLATHVTTVTIGYAASFVAGFLGIAFIGLGVFTPWLRKDVLRTLNQMIYGTVCFAMFFSFIGTVLGGLWADYSWGRFWGWDPKENGALLIVLWNALILHARWGGMVKQRGIALLAIGGNMITGWSWFGTNQLGVGLHAYGFNNTLAMGLAGFWVTQIVCIFVGLLPLSVWRSFAPNQPEPTVLALAPEGQAAAPPTVLPAEAPGAPRTAITRRKRR